MKTSKTPRLSWQNKLISTALASVSLFLGAPQLTLATLPSISSSNLVVTQGTATASITGSNTTSSTNTLTIAVPGTTSSNTVLNWQNFSDGTSIGGQLASNDTIFFNLPTANSAILNNILGNMATVLGGHISSNGNLFFLNPAGIIVGASSVINVNNFYASTIADATAPGYFFANGTLGVLNGVPQTTYASGTGVIYVQSGSSITVTPGSGSVNLVSNYSGSPISISNGTYTGPGSGSATLNTNNTGTAWGYIGGAANAVVSGIAVDSLTNSGNLNIIALGSAGVITGNGNSNGITLNQAYVASSTTLGGGNLTIGTSSGAIVINGPIATEKNISMVVSNPTSSSTIGYGSAIGSTSNVSAGGTVNISTAANVNFYSGSAPSNYIGLNSVGAATINAGSNGNITIYGDLNGGTLYGNDVVVTSPGSLARAYTNVTSYGTTTINSVGNLTISNLQTAAGMVISSTNGTAAVGSGTTLAALSTINGTPDYTPTIAGNSIIGFTGATLTNAVVNVGSNVAANLTVETNNISGSVAGSYTPPSNVIYYESTSTKPANVNITNVTVNGSVNAYALGAGSVTLSGITVLSNNTASNGSRTITAITNNGSITLSSVTTNNGAILATAYYTPLSGTPANSITLTNVVNQTTNYAFGTAPLAIASLDNFNTGNGNIAFNGYITTNSGILANSGNAAQQGVNKLNPTTLGGTGSEGNITTSGINIFNGPSNLTSNSGTITLTATIGGSTTAQYTANTVTLTTTNAAPQNGTAGNITFLANSDAVVNILGDAVPPDAKSTLNSFAVTISATGNLTTVGSITAPTISLVADSAKNTTGNLYLGGNVRTTLNLNTSTTSSITLQSYGNVSTLNMSSTAATYGISGNAQTLKLTSVGGNVDIANTNADPTQPVFIGNVTATATVGSVTLNSAGGFTSNGMTISAANGSFSEVNGTSLINTGNSNNTLSITAASALLGGNNSINGLKLVGGANGMIVNSGSSTQTVTLNSGTNVTGAVSITSSGPIQIGNANTDTVSISGFTTLSTLNTINPATGAVIGNSNGSITTVADSTTLTNGISALTYGASNSGGGNVTLGTTSNSGLIGQVSASALGGNVTVYTGTALNLGTISAANLNVVSNGVTNTSGALLITANANIFSGTPAQYGGAQAVPNSIQLGSTTTPAAITNINVTQGNSLNIVAATGVGVTATNVYAPIPMTNVVINDTDSASTASMSLYAPTSIGTITAATNGGALTVTGGTSIGSGSLSTTTGGITVTATGLGNVTFNLGNATKSSTITNLGTFTLNNLVNSSGATGAVTVSSNSNPGTGGASSLVLGTGINLQGSGLVTFTSGNSQTAGVTLTGGVSDTSTSSVTINAAAVTTFNGKTISITNTSSSYGPVAFTSNGTVTYTANGNISLAGLTLGTAATGTTAITSLTGNISQAKQFGAPVAFNITGKSESLSFTAASSGNAGIALASDANTGATITNSIASTTGVINISASGNVALRTDNNISLGSVSVIPSTTSAPSDSQLSLVSTTGNITQSSTSGVYVWGATSLTATGTAALTGVSLTNGAGNNFGALSVSTTNSNIVENATSSYAALNATNWTATSLKGDISTATNNSAFVVTGNSIITASNGNINLAGQATNQLEGIGSTITLSTGGNATVLETNSLTTIAAGSKIGGNLSITNAKNNASVRDQGGVTAIVVSGIASLNATGTNGTINFAGSNNSFGGLSLRGTTADVYAVGNFILAPGSAVTSAVLISTNGGNFTTAGLGGSTYGYLTISTNLGNVTISNQTSITSGLSINAPLGTVNLSGLSSSVDLHGLTPVITAATYIPPSS